MPARPSKKTPTKTATKPPKKTPAKTAATRRGAPGVTYETVVAAARAFPGVEEGTSYGTPALKVRGALLLRLREDGETIALRTTFVDRDLLTRAEPKTYFITEHYRNYTWVLVRLSAIRLAELRQRLEEAWRRMASRRLIAEWEKRA